jgi:hypothetical protein
MSDEPRPSRIKETKGRAALVRWMRENKETEGTFRKKVSVTRQAVIAWLEGITRPSLETRELVKLVTGIEPSSWDLPEDVEKRKQRLAVAMAGASKARKSKKRVH